MKQRVEAAELSTAPQTPEEVSLFVEDGKYVFRSNDATIYTYDRDVIGHSNCNGECAVTWPPVLASQKAGPIGNWTIITRADSSRQWAYKGKPLYTFAQDDPGEKSGDGAQGAWHVVKP
jgi:predicted lipoprotein with Yx(FWY)xxD motif